MTSSQPDTHFPGERQRLEAIRDCGRILEILQAQTDAFERKARACRMGHAIGLPPHLFKALECVLYDPSVKRRKMAAELIREWARRG